MYKVALFSSIGLFCAALYAEEISKLDPPSTYMQTIAVSGHNSKNFKECNVSAAPLEVGLRHIEGRGIGYRHGYTTLEYLIRPQINDYSMFPFVNLRGHIFDNGKFAANAGVGFRYRASSRIYGANTYYDYRNSNRMHYNQIGVGFETLGKIWDFRLNGYLPVGTKTSSWAGLEFGGFSGHSLLLKRKREFAFKGLNAEVGAHFPKVREIDTYLTAGPYYFEGKGKNAWGGKMRTGAKWKDYISLELSGSYDPVFHGIVQGQVGLNLPMGPKSKAKPKKDESCENLQLVMDRMVRQPVVREEIIVVDKQKKRFVALDPSTGSPYFFWFVNNLSGSNGTYESPFPVLSAVLQTGTASTYTPGLSNPGDIIYIFPGDGTTTGLNAGAGFYTLLNNQQVLGAATAYTFQTQYGAVNVPPQASDMPSITSAGVAVLAFSNNNTLSGLHLISTSSVNCIQPNTLIAPPYNNLSVTNCLIDLVDGGPGLILGNNTSGVYTISNNTFLSASGGNQISLSANNPGSTYIVTNNMFYGIGFLNNSTVPAVLLNNMASNTTFAVSGNTFLGFNSGVSFTGSGPSTTATITNNSFSSFNNAAAGFGINLGVLGANATYFVLGNTITGPTSGIGPANGIVLASPLTSLSAVISNNGISNMSSHGLTTATITAPTANLIMTGNAVGTTGSQAFNIASTSAALCVRFQYNQTSSGNLITQTGGNCNVEPLVGNSSNPVESGGPFTSVPQCTCGSCLPTYPFVY